MTHFKQEYLMNYTVLKKIADIRSGYTFRGKAKENPGSGIRMLQIRDVRENTVIHSHNLIEIEWQGNLNIPTIEQGDIAVVARGIANSAALMTGTEKVVPSNQLLVLSVRTEAVLSEYLCWWLNHPSTQTILTGFHVGTSIPSLSKKELSELRIPIPDISTQRKILNLAQLKLQEKTLYEQLLKNREMMLEGLFQQLLKNGETK